MREYFWDALLILAIVVGVSITLAEIRHHRELLSLAAQSKSRIPFDERMACGAESSGLADATEPYEDSEAYEVYSAIIPTIAPDPEMKMWLIGINTLRMPQFPNTDPRYDWMRKQSSQAKGTALSDFLNVNSKGWILQRKFDLPKPYELVTRDQLGKLLPETTVWRGHWIEFSAVGFNPDKTMALVSMWDWCTVSCCCGNSWSTVLEKQRDGKWKPIGGAYCAIS